MVVLMLSLYCHGTIIIIIIININNLPVCQWR